MYKIIGVVLIGLCWLCSSVIAIEFIFSPEEGFTLSAHRFQKYDVISTDGAGNYTALVASLSAVLPKNVSIDALQYYGPNNLIFSIGEDAVIQGNLLYKRDLLQWNGSTVLLIWDGDILPAQVNLDAVDVISLSPLEFSFSLAESATLPGVGLVHKSDMVHYLAGSGFTGKDFDALARGIPAQANLDAVMRISSTQWALSFDAESLLPAGSGTRFSKSDLVAYNPTSYVFNTTPLFSARANNLPAQVNINAISNAIYIPPYLNHHGSFTTASDTTQWLFEPYGDAVPPGPGAGSLTWENNYSGQTGVLRLSQTPGQKGKLTQVFSVPSSGWYTASALVATDVADPTKQQKVYLYLQELMSDTTIIATSNTIIQPGKGGFAGTGIWRQIKTSFYATATLLSVQLVGINPPATGLTSNLYLDEVWVVAGAPQPTGTVTLTNAGFTSDISGWLVEPYGDANPTPGAGSWSWLSNLDGRTGILSGYQSAGQKGKLTQAVDFPHGTNDVIGSLWVYSGAGTINDTQKVYLYIYSLNTTSGSVIIESGNAILQPGKWAQGVWRELKFGYKPLTGYHSVQIVGINRPGKPTLFIYVDSVDVKQD
ncbi:MAG: hypothetical protein N3A72_03505 [bacterium]|nr:hypothetical protein [bacterium]